MRFLGALAFFAGLALIYVLAAWQAGRRAGGRGLLGVWALFTVLLAVGVSVQVQRHQTALGLAPDPAGTAFLLTAYAFIGIFAFGAATLVLRRRLRMGVARLGASGAAAGVAGWFAGALTFLLLVILADLLQLMRVG